MARPMHLPFGLRAWKPAVPGAVLAAGHFLERGLSVRSGGVEHGAAHAPALRLAGLEARVPGGRARGWAFPGARTFSPQRARGARRGACACPLVWRAWKPAVPGAVLAAGHFLERGLSVRSRRGEHGAAHAPALRLAGLEARGPREIPTGKDAGGTLCCARNKRFRQMQAGLEARAPRERRAPRGPCACLSSLGVLGVRPHFPVSAPPSGKYVLGLAAGAAVLGPWSIMKERGRTAS